MPPKKEAPAKAAATAKSPAEDALGDEVEKELVEKELLISFLKTRLGR